MYPTPVIFPNKERERQRKRGVSCKRDGLTSLSLPKIGDCDVRWMGGSRALLVLHATSLPPLPVEVKGVLSLLYNRSDPPRGL